MSTVLVVEDGLTDMEVISSYLRSFGCSVISAKSSEEAQTKLDDKRPDMIFLDVILPGQSGFEMCRELKNNPKTKQIPVVICSTKGSDVDKMWGQMLGADAYLTKPVDQAELLKTVKLLIK